MKPKYLHLIEGTRLLFRTLMINPKNVNNLIVSSMFLLQSSTFFPIHNMSSRYITEVNLFDHR